jgi:GTPase SAR1 family protein
MAQQQQPKPGAPQQAGVQQALAVVDLAIKTARAYRREDLVSRLLNSKERVRDPSIRVLVVGEFKQGKSSLVNALLNADIAPVDDDVATSVPTLVRFAEQPTATAYREQEDGDPTPEDVAVDALPQYVSEAGNPSNERRLRSVEVGVPRKLLSGGLVLVDTPGVGGLGSVHSAITAAALPMADAVIFVSDASAEYSAPELDFLRMARDATPNIVCVLTKIDFYPEWRKIDALNRQHLIDAGLSAPLIPASAPLRRQAVDADDPDLNTESGYPRLIAYIQHEVIGNAERLEVRSAASDVLSVASQLEGQFASEREALKDPKRAQALIARLEEAKESANRLRSQAAKWQQTLGDGVADISADIDYDLRSRMRQVLQEGEAGIDVIDPGEKWSDFEAWLYRRVSGEAVENYTMLQKRAEELARAVAEHFESAEQDLNVALSTEAPRAIVTGVGVGQVEAGSKSALAAGMLALRGSYGGMMMFGMMARMAGLAMVNPLTVVLGVVMGHGAIKQERERQLALRRQQAKGSVRKYIDEVSFQMGKDSRDTIRRIQRQLRDTFQARAEELTRSATDSLLASQQAIKTDEAERQKRIRDVEAELARLRELRRQALVLAPELGAGGTATGR